MSGSNICSATFLPQVIVVDNYFTGSKENLKQWIGHPRFELIRHGKYMYFDLLLIHYMFNFHGCRINYA